MLHAMAAGLHLELVDRLERQPAARQVVVQVGDVEAVNVVPVFCDRRAAEPAQVAEHGIALHHAWRQGRHIDDVAAWANGFGCDAVNVVRASTVLTSIAGTALAVTVTLAAGVSAVEASFT
ncbi:hypothetical protein RKE25_00415 [Dyella sp. BiH032]|uniref:hypothetical protein n=1 Tax=Dyella sp. BiH032 TaxID=3075430 RepID=UPI0028937FFE|nr:hypothetical protein [Dyella sp. BiH032]WNL46136.1 hypothetical protein RKE25_00415 [Dyella sp. BiH032]